MFAYGLMSLLDGLNWMAAILIAAVAGAIVALTRQPLGEQRTRRFDDENDRVSRDRDLR
jgi:hypothetical protein